MNEYDFKKLVVSLVFMPDEYYAIFKQVFAETFTPEYFAEIEEQRAMTLPTEYVFEAVLKQKPKRKLYTSF